MRKNTLDTFWNKVNKTDHCWEWTGKLDEGYGKFSFAGKIHRTHRLSWELAHGPVPPGIKVCHTCDNRKCVRRDHLFLGTDQDNLGDAARKGRMGKKLSVRDVVHIIKLISAGVPASEIQSKVNVSKASIYGIKRGVSWSHLTGIKKTRARWSRDRDNCLVCNSNTRPHAARGMCDCCYVSNREKIKRMEKREHSKAT